jgi:hypothetical protein
MDRSGTDYATGTAYTANAAVTLFANWIADTYTVTYSVNGATGGTAPGVRTKTHNIELALMMNTGSLLRTGYSFNKLNSQVDRSETDLNSLF